MSEWHQWTRFIIPKRRGGVRMIFAPCQSLKETQRKILRETLYKLGPSPYAHGFVKGRSIVTNAAPHCGKNVIVNIDLKDFFPSITSPSIKMHLAVQLGGDMADYREIAETCCLPNGRLPQGAPTSPALSNIVFRNLDFVLAKIAREHFEADYTRYADDLTFSSLRHDLHRIIPIVNARVAAERFKVNPAKIRIMRRGKGRMAVTGLLVDGPKPRLSRQFRRKARAALHLARHRDFNRDWDRTKGYEAFIDMVE